MLRLGKTKETLEVGLNAFCLMIWPQKPMGGQGEECVD